jgi:hypothetical protein
LVLGSWFLVLGSWFLVLGSWFWALGSWFLALGSWFLVLGSWLLVLISEISIFECLNHDYFMKKILVSVLLIITCCVINAQIIKESKERYFYARLVSDTKIFNNSEVLFLTEDTIMLGTITIPVGTSFYSVAKFKDNRVFFSVNKIVFNKKFFDVNFSIVGNDFQDGLVLASNSKFGVFKNSDKVIFKVSGLTPKSNFAKQ